MCSNHFIDCSLKCFKPKVAKQSMFVYVYVYVLRLTLQFRIHGYVREAAQHGHDLIVLLLPQETQHAASVRVLETHKVLKAPNFILKEKRVDYIFSFTSLKYNARVHMQTNGRYLLGDAVAEVLLLKVGQLQKR